MFRTFMLTALLLLPTPTLAHKLNVFAHADGATLTGRVYFTGDIAARQIDVIARDPSGRELGRTRTDDLGSFTLTARVKTDHQLTAETADGHASHPPFVISAKLLPGSLPVDPLKSKSQLDSPVGTSPYDSAADRRKDPPLGDGQNKSLQKEIELLREQIDRSDQQLRFRDVLGGVGYILGVAGIAMYMLSRQHGTRAR